MPFVPVTHEVPITLPPRSHPDENPAPEHWDTRRHPTTTSRLSLRLPPTPAGSPRYRRTNLYPVPPGRTHRGGSCIGVTLSAPACGVSSSLMTRTVRDRPTGTPSEMTAYSSRDSHHAGDGGRHRTTTTPRRVHLGGTDRSRPGSGGRSVGDSGPSLRGGFGVSNPCRPRRRVVSVGVGTPTEEPQQPTHRSSSHGGRPSSPATCRNDTSTYSDELPGGRTSPSQGPVGSDLTGLG